MKTPVFSPKIGKPDSVLFSLRSLCLFFGIGSLLILTLLLANAAVYGDGTNPTDKREAFFCHDAHDQSQYDAGQKTFHPGIGDTGGKLIENVLCHNWQPVFHLLLVVFLFLSAAFFSIYRMKLEIQAIKTGHGKE